MEGLHFEMLLKYSPEKYVKYKPWADSFFQAEWCNMSNSQGDVL